MQKRKNREVKLVFAVLTAIFHIFLVIPVAGLLMKSFVWDGSTGITMENYQQVFASKGFAEAVENSILISCCSALITTILAFLLAYGGALVTARSMVNAMVTVSAVIFITGTRTMVITTKIKELQYFNKYNEIFVLSLLILFTSMISKYIFQKLAEKSQKKGKNQKGKKKDMKMTMKKIFKKIAFFAPAAVMGVSAMSLTGCGNGKTDDQVIIYSNADDEAIESMKHALDGNGYKDQYVFQTFGISELGGKLLAEGADIEADMVTMNTFYTDSAQAQNRIFL